MAQDHLIFHTNDRVVTSTSLGNQEKWFDAEKNLWYKVDNGHFEALAEAMASEVLRRFTNAADLPGISIAHYWVDTTDVHGLPQVLSVSENFKAGNESLITAHTILRNSLGRGYIQEFNDRNSLKERIVFLVDSVEAATGFSGFGAYFTTLLELDALPIINENDTVATDEITSIGDNDTLAAIVTCCIHADLLVLLSDIDGLYTANPHTHPDAKLIPLVERITPEVLALADGAGSALGTGGMSTKLRAAQMVTAEGADMVIANGSHPELLYDIADGRPAGTRFAGRKES